MASRRTRREQAAQRAEAQRAAAVAHDMRAAEIFSGLNIAPTFPDGIPAVSGGFRAGKRRRGNSLLKSAPVTTTRITARYSTFQDGIPIRADERTIHYSASYAPTFQPVPSSPAPTVTPNALTVSDVPAIARTSHDDPLIARFIETCDRIIAEHDSRENLMRRDSLNIAQEVRASVKNGTSRETAIARAIARRMPKRPMGAYLP